MRLTLAGDRRTSKMTVWYRLDEIHRGGGMRELLLHFHNPLHPMAVEWANKHDVPMTIVGSQKVGVFGPRDTIRIVWGALFRLSRPDVLLIFGDETFLEAGDGRFLRRHAEDYDVDVWYTTPVNRGPKCEERCLAPSPSGKQFCTKYKHHPGGWHANFQDGKRKNAWRDSACKRDLRVVETRP